MYITCIYLHISGVLNPGESFWCHAALYDMCPKSTSNGEGNGTPLQCSCLENPRDGGTEWAAVYGVTQSWTRQKRLSSSSSSTSRLHFRNIDRSMRQSLHLPCFSRFLLPTSSQAHQHLRNLFGLLLINSLTDGPPVKCRYSSLMFRAARDSHVGEREQAEPPQAGDSPFWVERIGCPAQDDV